MPPVTPSPIRATLLLDADAADLLDLATQHFALRDGDLLLAVFAGQCARQQLSGTLARDHHELETILSRCSFHVDSLNFLNPAGLKSRPPYLSATVTLPDAPDYSNVSTISSAAGRIWLT